jgi:hypothetical protein
MHEKRFCKGMDANEYQWYQLLSSCLASRMFSQFISHIVAFCLSNRVCHLQNLATTSAFKNFNKSQHLLEAAFNVASCCASYLAFWI